MTEGILIPLKLNLNIDETPWTEDLAPLIANGKLLTAQGLATVDRVGGLAGGMQSGAPSVAFWVTLPDGQVVIAETSMRLFVNAANAFRVRYGIEAGTWGKE